MSKIDLDNIASGYNLSKINGNFQKLEDELNNNVLYRQDNPGEPNHMSTDLDMNSKRILNLLDAVELSEPVTLRQLIEVDSGEALELRADLAAGNGASLVGFTQAGSGAIPRTSLEKMREVVSAQDFGAIGDGIANDQLAFSTLEGTFTNRVIDLLGKTYSVTTIPVGNLYVNGKFTIASGTWDNTYKDVIRAWDTPLAPDGPGPGVIAIGTNAAKLIPDDRLEPDSRGVIAIGRDALGNTHRGVMNIAIGDNTISKGQPGAANIAIGAFALTNLQGNSDSVSSTNGSRNIGIGSLSGHFLTSGFRNTLIGRDSGQSLVTGFHNTGVGYRALSSARCPVGLSGQIENQEPSTAGGANVAIGFNAMASGVEGSNVIIGSSSAPEMVVGSGHVFIGALAGEAFNKKISARNKLMTDISVSGTYSQSGNTITVSAVATGVVAGNKVEITFTSGGVNSITGEAQWITVASVINPNTFTLSSPQSMTASGNVLVTRVETATTVAPGGQCVAIGYQANYLAEMNGGNSTYVGQGTGQSSTGAQCTLVGSRAGFNLTTGTNVSALGYNAARALIGGGGITTESNITCLGSGTAISGSNQVQLGDPATTTYVYGTVQNRSDLNDKTGVRDTVLGIDYIMGLRPVDYRWNMREDYVEYYEQQVGINPETAEPIFETRTRVLVNDGSKARNRFHHGFIAQEVKELTDRLGVDFGGYQDHKVNGGCDVLSLGYDEFIAPAIKAIQQCWGRLDSIEARIASLESKNA